MFGLLLELRVFPADTRVSRCHLYASTPESLGFLTGFWGFPADTRVYRGHVKVRVRAAKFPLLETKFSLCKIIWMVKLYAQRPGHERNAVPVSALSLEFHMTDIIKYSTPQTLKSLKTVASSFKTQE